MSRAIAVVGALKQVLKQQVSGPSEVASEVKHGLPQLFPAIYRPQRVT